MVADLAVLVTVSVMGEVVEEVVRVKNEAQHQSTQGDIAVCGRA